jgi:hypothetical protein
VSARPRGLIDRKRVVSSYREWSSPAVARSQSSAHRVAVSGGRRDVREARPAATCRAWVALRAGTARPAGRRDPPASHPRQAGVLAGKLPAHLPGARPPALRGRAALPGQSWPARPFQRAAAGAMGFDCGAGVRRNPSCAATRRSMRQSRPRQGRGVREGIVLTEMGVAAHLPPERAGRREKIWVYQS